MKIHRFFAGFLLIVPFFTCDSFEIKPVSEVSATSYLRWNIQRGPVTVFLNSSGSQDVSLSVVESGVQAALDTWEGVTRQNLNVQYEGISKNGARDGDEWNTIQWIENGWKYSTSVLAITKYTYFVQDPPVFYDADILFNGEYYSWGVNLAENSSRLDFRQVLVHEIGHMLGLAHTSVSRAQMFPYLQGEVRYSLTRDDKEGLRFLYGDGASSFQLVTPVKKALYERQMARRGLPLPVFRWGPGPVNDYVLEFSSSDKFERKISIAAGSGLFYALQPADERKILKIATSNLVYWRVRSGSTVTPARFIRFTDH